LLRKNVIEICVAFELAAQCLRENYTVISKRHDFSHGSRILVKT